jgi:hypothetical protein
VVLMHSVIIYGKNEASVVVGTYSDIGAAKFVADVYRKRGNKVMVKTAP